MIHDFWSKQVYYGFWSNKQVHRSGFAVYATIYGVKVAVTEVSSNIDIHVSGCDDVYCIGPVTLNSFEASVYPSNRNSGFAAGELENVFDRYGIRHDCLTYLEGKEYKPVLSTEGAVYLWNKWKQEHHDYIGIQNFINSKVSPTPDKVDFIKYIGIDIEI